MKATIDFLWDTGRQIISFEGSDFDRPTTFTELKKCDNVTVGPKIFSDTQYEDRLVMIDGNVYIVCPSTAMHTGETIRFLEII